MQDTQSPTTDAGHKDASKDTTHKDMTVDMPSSPQKKNPFDNLVPEGFPDSTTTGLKTKIETLTLHEGNYNTSQDGEKASAPLLISPMITTRY